MWAYVEGDRCRRETILGHFGDPVAGAPTVPCCDVCAAELVAAYTVASPGRRRGAPAGATAVSVDDAIIEVVRSAQPACGRTRVVEILRGGRSKKLLEHSYDGLPAYGSLDHLSGHEVLARVDELLDAGRLRSTGGAYPTLAIAA